MTSYRDELTGIGAELRDGRMARGVTIDDAQRATRIARRYLQALEDEDFEALPAPVFARGFLRSYAQYLSLDPTELVARFPGEPRVSSDLPDVSRIDDAPGRRIPRPDGGFGPRSEERLDAIPQIDTTSPSVRLGPWLVAGFVVLAVLAGVVAVVTIGDDETPVGGSPALSPGVEGPADQEAQGTGVTTEPVIRLVTMPELTDRTVSDAIVVLRRSGLPFVIVELFDPNTPTGAVIDQTPEPGTALDTGTAVTLVVSRGPQLTPVDDEGAEDAGSDSADADVEPAADSAAPLDGAQ